MKETKTPGILTYKARIFILGILLISLLAFHFSWIIKAAGDGKFFLLHEDEVIYFCSGKLFSETNALQAESCIEEKVSRIGRINWYGPGFNLVYGTLFKITGPKEASIPWFNFVLAMAALGIILFLPANLEARLLIAIALASTYQFCVYIHTYFPETLILFLAVVLTLLLVLLHYEQHPDKKRRYLIAFMACTLLFMLCRITFVFWFAGLIGLAENRKQLRLAGAVFFAAVALSLVYMKLFIAPPWASDMQKIDLLFDLKLFTFFYESQKAFFNNYAFLFSDNASVTSLIIFGLLAVGAIVYYQNRNRLILAALLISITVIAVLLAYYSVYGFFFIKQTDMVIPLLLVALGLGSNFKSVPYGVAAILLLSFPGPFKHTLAAISTGRQAYEHYANHTSFKDALAEIPDHIQGRRTTILWDYREYDYGYSAQALLPFATREKEPIMYTTNIVDGSASPEARFQRHNRLKIDYILSRQPLSWPDLKEVHTTSFYHLYQISN